MDSALRDNSAGPSLWRREAPMLTRCMPRSIAPTPAPTRSTSRFSLIRFVHVCLVWEPVHREAARALAGLPPVARKMPRLARHIHDITLFGFELINSLDVVTDMPEHDQPELAAFLVIVALVAGLRRLIAAEDDIGKAAIVGHERAAPLFTGDHLAKIHDLTILRVQHAAATVDTRLHVLKAGHRHRRLVERIQLAGARHVHLKSQRRLGADVLDLIERAVRH